MTTTTPTTTTPITTTPTRPTRRTTRTRALRTVGALALTAVVGLSAACSSDDTTARPAEDGSSTTATTATTGHDHVEVTAADFAFDGLPSSIAAGTRLSLRNGAPKELHELVAFRLPDDEQRPVTELIRLPEAELGAILGQPATVLLAAPGADQIPAVGDGTLSRPGRYLVMCSIPMGVEPAEYLKAAAAAGGQKPDVDGGPPHFTSGMLSELTVR